jgi:hypothetical protein
LECAACCEGWLRADIGGTQISPLKPCGFSTAKGCAIYERRPVNPCQTFKCGWLKEDSPLPEHMKPNKCGAIVMFDRKWVGRQTNFAIPVGKKVPADTLEWLMAYSREHSIPLIFYENLIENGLFTGVKRTGYGPSSFVHAVQNEIKPEDIFM